MRRGLAVVTQAGGQRPRIGVRGALCTAALAALLTGCTDQLGSRGGDGYAPDAVPRGEQSVDGLIVGHRLMAAGEYELALKYYLRAGAEHGVTVDVLSAVGSANLRLGRLGQAEDILRRAVKVDETFVPAWNNLGVVLMETGQVAEASRVFRIAFSLDGGKTDAIRENLRLALAKLDNITYDAPDNDADFALVRRGVGDYLLLATP